MRVGRGTRANVQWEKTMKKPAIWILAVVAGLASLAGATATRVLAADKHPFGIDDYSALHSARAVAVSPDGITILYQVSFDGTTGPANKREWHLMDASGENPRKLDLPENFVPTGFTKEGSALYGVYP